MQNVFNNEAGTKTCISQGATWQLQSLLTSVFRSYPEPLSFSDRVSALFSDVLLTLSLDWLALSPASAPAAGGSFLFFLAKNFLNVWNLDFFFPVSKEKKKKLCTSVSLGKHHGGLLHLTTLLLYKLENYPHVIFINNLNVNSSLGN